MRTYYIFKITDEYYGLYQNKEAMLFELLEQVQKLSKNDIGFVKHLYEQIVEPFHKISLNEYIYQKHIEDISYTKYLHTHMFYDVFGGEETTLNVHNRYIKLSSNLNFPTFLYDLFEYETNLFVCDFASSDYFWVGKMLKELV